MWTSRYWTTFFPAVVVLGIGMAISLTPPHSCYERSACGPVRYRLRNLQCNFPLGQLARRAVLALVLLTAYRHDLSRRLAPERQSIDKQRSRLAAIQTGDPRIEHAVDEAFGSDLMRTSERK